MSDTDQPITEEWLRATGFRWEQFDRQPFKHWLLWVADAASDADARMIGSDDLGVELTPTSAPREGEPREWHCWIRSDIAGRYTRFLHIRLLTTVGELTRLIEGMTGVPWNAADVMYGSLRHPKRAARMREHEKGRVDIGMAQGWAERAERERGRTLDPAERRVINNRD